MRQIHSMQIVGLALLVAITGACGSGGTVENNEADTTTTTVPSVDGRQILDEAREAYGAPGALALVRHDDTEWRAVSGTADLAGTPITPDTRFRIASITKPIVAVATLDAVQREELSLDAVVGDLLPGVVRADPPITVRMLLSHTSGVFDVGNESDPLADIELLTDPGLQEEARALAAGYEAGETVIASDLLFVSLAELHDRYFDPGAGYHYSNANYQLAAMVLEEVTGRPIAELLEERIFDPLSLQSTTLAPPDTSTPDFHGYGTSVDDGSLVDITDDLVAFGNGGSGGIISTADELLTMLQAIASSRFVGGNLLAEMRTPTEQSDLSYGLGLATYYLSCGVFVGHEGGVNGTASIALVSRDGSDGVVVAMNLRNGNDPHLPQLADQLLCGLR